MIEVGAAGGNVDLVRFLEDSLTRVLADFERARTLVKSAIGQLFVTFTNLRGHLAEERAHYEDAVATITGRGADAGLVQVLREVLSRFVGEVARLGQNSVKILLEVEALRANAEAVAGRGLRIEKIAQTTRMISLNARVEAARVTGSGSVFRVVADEIKALAKESSELSQTIRDAIAAQAASLDAVNTAAAHLSSVDLDHAVASKRQLEDTIEGLARVSAASSRALDAIQADLDAAIHALQFEDMLDQLMAGIRRKLEAMREACAAARGGGAVAAAVATVEAELGREAVTQHDITVGSVELF